MRKLLRKLGYYLRRDRQAEELAEELEFHRSLAEQEGLEEGLAPKDAALRARRRMGNETLAREDARSIWSFPLLDDLWQDLRYGVRVLSRHRGSTVVTVLVLAIGIGLNTAVFTGFKAMDPTIDASNPEEMVNIALIRDSDQVQNRFSYPDYEIYRDSIRSFSGLAAFGGGSMVLSNAGRAISRRDGLTYSWASSLGFLGGNTDELADVGVVSENYFEVFGVAPIRGRTFESMSSAELAAEPPVVISENYWQRRFEGDPEILGKTVRLNNVAVTIIGITPHDFAGTGVKVPNFWLPLSIEPLVNADEEWLEKRENRRYSLVARLAPGASIDQAQAEMSAVVDRVRTLHDPLSEAAEPAAALVWPCSTMPLPLARNAGQLWIIMLLTSATGVVLAVACANVASLQLARARSRESELRTRLSLGASRLRVIRQLLTESALVGLLGGTLALFFAWALLKQLFWWLSMAITDDTIVIDPTPDLAVFACVVAVSLFAGMLSGLAPAMESSRAALAAVVGAATSSSRSRRLQNVLVAVQVSLSLVLLIAAGMLIRSSLNVIHTDTGYDSGQVASVSAGFSQASGYSDDRQLALLRDLRTRLEALPGVAAVTRAMPPSENTSFKTIGVPLQEAGGEDQNEQLVLGYTFVEGNYFQTLGIPVLLGRSFEHQGGEPQQSVILSESAANQLWPDQYPIGRRLRLGPTDEQRRRPSELSADGPTYQVVGIARDKQLVEYGGGFSNDIYLPLPEGQFQRRSLLVRVDGDMTAVREAINTLPSAIDPHLWTGSWTLEQMIRFSNPFITSAMAGAVAIVIGSCGLLLALIGIYGTVSYVVVLRTREVGIRVAIGAQRRDVLGLILGETSRPVLAGLVWGMLLAVGVSYVGRGLFYGIDGIDPISLAGVSALFLAVALLASYLPARRALQVDPLAALRYE